MVGSHHDATRWRLHDGAVDVAPRHALPRLGLEQPIGRHLTALRVIDADAELLGPLDGVAAKAARQHLVARTRWLEPGEFSSLGNDLPPNFDGWLGMLILDGLLVREVQVGEMRCSELLGAGDIVRPWDEDDGGETLECFARWRVIEPTRLALLDADFALRAGRWPSVGGELMQRALARSRALGILLALTQARRADVRLRTLFWHLADRWGRVTPSGVVLSLNLTHGLIGQLTGLCRPSVSLALGELERAGEIQRLDKGSWLIVRCG
jgi:CRP/FNR family cyclic AMP-dependent transcriptional regulator